MRGHGKVGGWSYDAPISRLSPNARLGIHLGAIMSRNQYTRTPELVVAELLETAGDNHAVLQEAVGSWVGFYEDDYTRQLCDALRGLPGLEPWIVQGAHRRGLAHHSTPGARSGAVSSWPREVV